MAGIDPAKIKQIEGATYYVSEEPTLAEIALFPLPVNFKIVNSVDSTYKIVSFKADGTRLELTTDSSGGATNVITEDSDTITFTGNGTVGNPLSAESVGGDYIPLSGTEVGKPVTGPIDILEDAKIFNLPAAKDGNITSFISDSTNFIGYGVESEPGMKTIISSFGIDVYNAGGSVGIYSSSFEDVRNFIFITSNNTMLPFAGMEGDGYYGANYGDNTYIQKKYVDDANSYSTTETLTGGTWIDGKPIYKKYITISLPSGSASAVSFAYPTFQIIDFEKCFLTLPAGIRRTPNGTSQGFENDWVFSIENDSSLLIKPDISSAQIRTISGVLLYTKTTDVAP